jgi:ABC-type dipeptide/oligopeptide/nickel transport system ATPase component
LGIARALYKKDASILILDEATSALDIETERKLLNAIISKSDYSTIVMVTHRPDTLRFCNKAFEVRDGFLISTKQ